MGLEFTSRRSLALHAWITLSATLLGFVLGAGLGVVLAVAIVHNDAADRSLMPWIIASQTIPILAIAPMVVVGLGAVGLTFVILSPKDSVLLYFWGTDEAAKQNAAALKSISDSIKAVEQ